MEAAEEVGNSPEVALGTYAHVVKELRGAERVPAEDAILRARSRKQIQHGPR